MERFQDKGYTIYEFSHTFLVRCPRCDKCARVSRLPPLPKFIASPSPARVVCEWCGYTKDRGKEPYAAGGSVDWFFGLPLWLQTPCCGDILWAYNLEQLEYLENFVRADLREGMYEPKHQTYLTKLPGWIKSAKNRAEVLKGIEKLKEMAKS